MKKILTDITHNGSGSADSFKICFLFSFIVISVKIITMDEFSPELLFAYMAASGGTGMINKYISVNKKNKGANGE